MDENMHSKIGMHINHDRYQSADDNLLQKAARKEKNSLVLNSKLLQDPQLQYR